MARDIASEAACWVHIDKESERLVFTRGAAPNDAISCPLSWLPMISDIINRDALGFREKVVLLLRSGHLLHGERNPTDEDIFEAIRYAMSGGS